MRVKIAGPAGVELSPSAGVLSAVWIAIAGKASYSYYSVPRVAAY